MKPDKPKAIEQLTCLRCGHKWYPKSDKLPVVCPACKRYSWNEPLKPAAKAETK